MILRMVFILIRAVMMTEILSFPGSPRGSRRVLVMNTKYCFPCIFVQENPLFRFTKLTHYFIFYKFYQPNLSVIYRFNHHFNYTRRHFNNFCKSKLILPPSCASPPDPLHLFRRGIPLSLPLSPDAVSATPLTDIPFPITQPPKFFTATCKKFQTDNDFLRNY